MGLDIGIINITYLPRPQGWAYKFAWELAVEASHGYMSGDGNNWAAFTQRQVLDLLDDFIQHKNLGATAEAEILLWVRSLPWTDWEEQLDRSLPPAEELEPGEPTPGQGGFIELHFNW
jgi:hypothetical protein